MRSFQGLTEMGRYHQTLQGEHFDLRDPNSRGTARSGRPSKRCPRLRFS